MTGFVGKLEKKGVESEVVSQSQQKSYKSRRYSNEFYTEEDYNLNRKVTLLYGVTFLFLAFSVVMSEILSIVFDEGLLSPVQVIFHSISFIGYVITFRYVYRKQYHIEEKNVQVFRKQKEIDKAEEKW